MGSETIKNYKALKCGSAINILSMIALLFTVLRIVCDLTDIPLYYRGVRYVFYSILTLAPIILLVLYVFKFYNKLKATVLVPIIFGVLGIKTVFILCIGYDKYVFADGIYLFLNLLKLGCSILAVISALKGFSKKVFIIVYISICILYEVLGLISMFNWIDYYIKTSMYLPIFTLLLSFVGKILLYTDLILFSLKNKIPSVLSVSYEKKKKQKYNPEQALKLLKVKFDNNIITEAEYQRERAEIISKL